jgi:glutamine amidotransferase
MCELLAISSRQAARLSFSLSALTARTTPGHSNRDGWGVACYQGRDAALYREAAPASDSPLARLLASAGPPTALALSHIRHAIRGATTLANTQPFLRELGGRSHVFAHNGNLPDLTDAPGFALAQFQPVGETDSEHAFCALLARLAPLWRGQGVPSVQDRLDVVRTFASELRTFGPANFLYADGEVLFAHGHRRIQVDGRITPPGLYWLQRRCTHEDDTLQTEGLRVGGGYQQVLLLASVPLSAEPWVALAEGETVAVCQGELLARHQPTDSAPGGALRSAT